MVCGAGDVAERLAVACVWSCMLGAWSSDAVLGRGQSSGPLADHQRGMYLISHRGCGAMAQPTDCKQWFRLRGMQEGT